METPSQPKSPIDPTNRLYHQVVHTLTGLLPPPLDDTPETLLTRNHAAIAKVAALLPVNAYEADLAAQCIASRAQAEDILRLLRQHAGDIGLVIRLNAQYGSMVRTSLSVHARLTRVQALRYKREATNGTANQDAWTLHVAEQSMLGVMDAGSQTTSPEPAPAADVHQTTPEYFSKDETNSQDAASETVLAELRNRSPVTMWLFEAARNAMPESRAASQDSPANGCEDPESAGHGCPIDGETASA